MEKEIPKQNNEGLSRQQKIENFLLNPDKEIFNSLEEFKEAVDYIKSLVGNLDLNELENIQGEDGKNPELGIDYLTDEDLDKIDQFIQDRINSSWSSYPTKEEIVSSIENKVNSEVAKIPRVKGEPGKDGDPGKNGSPDTAEKILEKLRALPKNKKLAVSDVRGLQNELNKIAQDKESSIEDVLKIINSLKISIPILDSGIKSLTGLIQQGANITITGTGTILDPYTINASGAIWGSITGTLSSQTDLQDALNLKAPLLSPLFTTPSLGVATAISINGLSLSANNTDYNTFLGKNSGLYVIPGAKYNTYVGYEAGKSDAAGGTIAVMYNSGFGFRTLFSNTTGNYNAAQGSNSLYSNTAGFQNSAQGAYSLALNDTGSFNSAQGYSSLYSNSTGIYNTAQGHESGRYIANGTTGRATGNYGLYLGANTKASANALSNEIVIGYNAIGNGSNTATIGNSSVLNNYFSGNINIPTGKTYNINGAALNPDNLNDTATLHKFVTAADITKLSNLSNINSGDNAVNSLYSGLAASKQDTLVSATNIKTINGATILGSGDMVIAGAGGTVTAVSVATANGVSGTSSGGATPALTLALGVITPTSVAVSGTAGAGFLSLVGQSANPTSPVAGTLLLHSSTANGFTRMEQDNESATNLIYGRDNVIIGKNTTAAIIVKGSTVYVTGSTGNVPNIAKAQANSATTLPAIGVVLNDIAINGFGQIMTVGIVSSLDTSAFAVGAPVWVSITVAGGLTATRPSGTVNSAQRVGSILVSGIGNGSLMVNISPSVLNMETGTNAATWSGTNINLSSLTPSQILATDASKNLVSLPVATYPSLAELAFVKGVTSGIQAQINAKGVGTVTGTGTINELSYWTGASSQGTLPVATYPSLTELTYMKGVTSAIQTQLNGKQASGSYLVAADIVGKANLASPTFTGVVTTPAIKITTGAGESKVLTSDINGDATWQTPSSSGAASANVQTFGTVSTSGSFTWTKPAGAKWVQIICKGGGGGGSYFPSGGGGGAITFNYFNASILGTTETVTVGVGGIGGTSANYNSSPGGNSFFGTWARAGGGDGAIPNTKGGVGGGSFGVGLPSNLSSYSTGAIGGQGGESSGTNGTCAEFGGGGASGSGVGGNQYKGGSSIFGGGAGGCFASEGGTSGSYTSGGGGAPGVNGADGASGLTLHKYCGAGGGGGSSGNGGKGGFPSGGGGSAAASGVGGSVNAGANGEVIVTTYF